jgi:two-component system sensor histidine kinase RpfC
MVIIILHSSSLYRSTHLLTGVIGMVEVLMDTSLNDEQKEIANTISRSAITLHYLINNILDVSKLEAGKLEFVRTLDFHETYLT